MIKYRTGMSSVSDPEPDPDPGSIKRTKRRGKTQPKDR
jgi:hypothetical protein